VCRALTGSPEGGGDAPDAEAGALIVRKALSGVARIHGRFGLGTAVKLVHGDADPRLERAGLTSLRTFGNLREYPEPWLLGLLRRCITAGWVSFAGGDRPVALLTEEGRAVMKGERPARLLLPQLAGGRGKARGTEAPRRPSRPAGEPAAADAAGEALFEALRRHRLALARAEGVAPFMIASDRTLRDIALLRPRTLDELLMAHGIGRHKADRYGAGFLQVVNTRSPSGAEHQSSFPIRPGGEE
jgi:ATP-dependent DNA helicase RecQ